MTAVTHDPTIPGLKQVRAGLHLSRERMGHVMSVSAKTIERWEERGTLPLDDTRRALLVQVAGIVDLGTRVYTPEGFTAFLNTPLPEFGHRTALQELESGHIDAVFGALASDYEGLGN